jgi:ribosomal protein S18 acetylase RimI-like enzyme
MDFEIRPTTEHDWREVRALRLEMVKDTPMGFAESYETALTHDEAEWRRRGARGGGAASAAFAAIADRRWVGTMSGYVDAGRPMLVGVYVTPDYRGQAGVADALLAAVEHWATQHGETITLHVHADNLRARRYYEKRGYIETGVTLPYVLNAAETEIEMAKSLATG